MANVTFLDVMEYFETIATEHIAIQHSDSEKHFARINIDEVLGGLKTKLKFPALVVESPEGFFTDDTIDNVLRGYVIGFTIVDRVKPGDFDGEETVLAITEQMVMDIVSRLRKEHRDYSTAGIISRAFQLNTVRWNKVGPLWENCFGWRCTFQVQNPNSLAYDEEKWTS